ncbi:MAG TPA: fructosamine kinase family protein [Nannocystaceae bacterium]|nr:fructosamine kinase family protein [Nannocystaceae bacterium]
MGSEGQRLVAALARELGVAVVRADATRGGDSHRAIAATLADGRRVFVKHGADAATYAAEAHGLAWLADARALATPEVLAVGDDNAPYLAIAFVDTGAESRDYDERLGRALAALHRFGAPAFGLARPNVMGRVPQDNRPLPTWAEFYAERRLAPLVQRTRDDGALDETTARAVDDVIARMPALVGPDEPPARLHGDLWSGNVMCSSSGAPVLVDPAVYGGHREIDLAMLRLFGGPGPRFFAAYDEAFPLAPGVADRVPLYQLYPLLVHVAMFGASYTAQVRRAARALL